MTDREMLELAAKAAGHTLGPDWDCLPSGIFINGDEHFSGDEWNPLLDDGDALRLAVKLSLTINVSGMFVHADCCNRYDDIGYFEENSARNDGCILKAARRVIVRAAAAIGEEMK